MMSSYFGWMQKKLCQSNRSPCSDRITGHVEEGVSIIALNLL